MIDTEVARLRRLRNTALRARALAAALDSDPARLGSVFSRGAVNCWQIARVITHHALSDELRGVARELDDARALTWSSDLSDALGRSQRQIRGLIEELDADAGVRTASGSRHETAPRAETRIAAVRDDAGSVAGNWPYLAI